MGENNFEVRYRNLDADSEIHHDCSGPRTRTPTKTHAHRSIFQKEDGDRGSIAGRITSIRSAAASFMARFDATLREIESRNSQPTCRPDLAASRRHKRSGLGGPRRSLTSSCLSNFDQPEATDSGQICNTKSCGTSPAKSRRPTRVHDTELRRAKANAFYPRSDNEGCQRQITCDNEDENRSKQFSDYEKILAAAVAPTADRLDRKSPFSPQNRAHSELAASPGRYNGNCSDHDGCRLFALGDHCKSASGTSLRDGMEAGICISKNQLVQRTFPANVVRKVGVAPDLVKLQSHSSRGMAVPQGLATVLSPNNFQRTASFRIHNQERLGRGLAAVILDPGSTSQEFLLQPTGRHVQSHHAVSCPYSPQRIADIDKSEEIKFPTLPDDNNSRACSTKNSPIRLKTGSGSKHQQQVGSDRDFKVVMKLRTTRGRSGNRSQSGSPGPNQRDMENKVSHGYSACQTSFRVPFDRLDRESPDGSLTSQSLGTSERRLSSRNMTVGTKRKCSELSTAVVCGSHRPSSRPPGAYGSCEKTTGCEGIEDPEQVLHKGRSSRRTPKEHSMSKRHGNALDDNEEGLRSKYQGRGSNQYTTAHYSRRQQSRCPRSSTNEKQQSLQHERLTQRSSMPSTSFPTRVFASAPPDADLELNFRPQVSRTLVSPPHLSTDQEFGLCTTGDERQNFTSQTKGMSSIGTDALLSDRQSAWYYCSDGQYFHQEPEKSIPIATTSSQRVSDFDEGKGRPIFLERVKTSSPVDSAPCSGEFDPYSCNEESTLLDQGMRSSSLKFDDCMFSRKSDSFIPNEVSSSRNQEGLRSTTSLVNSGSLEMPSYNKDSTARQSLPSQEQGNSTSARSSALQSDPYAGYAEQGSSSQEIRSSVAPLLSSRRSDYNELTAEQSLPSQGPRDSTSSRPSGLQSGPCVGYAEQGSSQERRSCCAPTFSSRRSDYNELTAEQSLEEVQPPGPRTSTSPRPSTLESGSYAGHMEQGSRFQEFRYVSNGQQVSSSQEIRLSVPITLSLRHSDSSELIVNQQSLKPREPRTLASERDSLSHGLEIRLSVPPNELVAKQNSLSPESRVSVSTNEVIAKQSLPSNGPRTISGSSRPSAQWSESYTDNNAEQGSLFQEIGPARPTLSLGHSNSNELIMAQESANLAMSPPEVCRGSRPQSRVDSDKIYEEQTFQQGLRTSGTPAASSISKQTSDSYTFMQEEIIASSPGPRSMTSSIATNPLMRHSQCQTDEFYKDQAAAPRQGNHGPENLRGESLPVGPGRLNREFGSTFSLNEEQQVHDMSVQVPEQNIHQHEESREFVSEPLEDSVELEASNATVLSRRQTNFGEPTEGQGWMASTQSVRYSTDHSFPNQEWRMSIPSGPVRSRSQSYARSEQINGEGLVPWPEVQLRTSALGNNFSEQGSDFYTRSSFKEGQALHDRQSSRGEFPASPSGSRRQTDSNMGNEKDDPLHGMLQGTSLNSRDITRNASTGLGMKLMETQLPKRLCHPTLRADGDFPEFSYMSNNTPHYQELDVEDSCEELIKCSFSTAGMNPFWACKHAIAQLQKANSERLQHCIQSCKPTKGGQFLKCSCHLPQGTASRSRSRKVPMGTSDSSSESATDQSLTLSSIDLESQNDCSISDESLSKLETTRESSSSTPNVWARGHNNTYAKLIADAKKSQMILDKAKLQTSVLSKVLHNSNYKTDKPGVPCSHQDKNEAGSSSERKLKIKDWEEETSKWSLTRSSSSSSSTSNTAPRPTSTALRIPTCTAAIASTVRTPRRADRFCDKLHNHCGSLQQELQQRSRTGSTRGRRLSRLASRMTYKDRMTSITNLLNSMNSITQLLNTTLPSTEDHSRALQNDESKFFMIRNQPSSNIQFQKQSSQLANRHPEQFSTREVPQDVQQDGEPEWQERSLATGERRSNSAVASTSGTRVSSCAQQPELMGLPVVPGGDSDLQQQVRNPSTRGMVSPQDSSWQAQPDAEMVSERSSMRAIQRLSSQMVNINSNNIPELAQRRPLQNVEAQEGGPANEIPQQAEALSTGQLRPSLTSRMNTSNTGTERRLSSKVLFDPGGSGADQVTKQVSPADVDLAHHSRMTVSGSEPRMSLARQSQLRSQSYFPDQRHSIPGPPQELFVPASTGSTRRSAGSAGSQEGSGGQTSSQPPERNFLVTGQDKNDSNSNNFRTQRLSGYELLELQSQSQGPEGGSLMMGQRPSLDGIYQKATDQQQIEDGSSIPRPSMQRASRGSRSGMSALGSDLRMPGQTLSNVQSQDRRSSMLHPEFSTHGSQLQQLDVPFQWQMTGTSDRQSTLQANHPSRLQDHGSGQYIQARLSATGVGYGQKQPSQSLAAAATRSSTSSSVEDLNYQDELDPDAEAPAPPHVQQSQGMDVNYEPNFEFQILSQVPTHKRFSRSSGHGLQTSFLSAMAQKSDLKGTDSPSCGSSCACCIPCPARDHDQSFRHGQDVAMSRMPSDCGLQSPRSSNPRHDQVLHSDSVNREAIDRLRKSLSIAVDTILQELEALESRSCQNSNSVPGPHEGQSHYDSHSPVPVASHSEVQQLATLLTLMGGNLPRLQPHLMVRRRAMPRRFNTKPP